MWLYGELLGDTLFMKYLGWVLIPLLLILFAAGFVHIVSPQVGALSFRDHSLYISIVFYCHRLLAREFPR